MKIRFIDAGTVSGLRSQSIYHGLGYAQKTDTPDTIVLATPGTPYMCIGFFQDPQIELNMKYCRDEQLPIIRRETGGGSVYIDEGQLFVQWVFQQSSLPKRVDQRFQLFVKPLIETYKFFGINAYYHPINDVHVDGKKIVGTGAGTIGEAQVVTGNFLFDFDYSVMINAINSPSDEFRDALADNLHLYLATMRQELERLPERNEVINVYRTKCEKILGLDSELGNFTDEELLLMEKWDKKFVDNEWLFQTRKKPSINKLLKIHLGVWIGQVTEKIDGGIVKLLITMKDDYITMIKINVEGLENLHYSVSELEKSLTGVMMDRDLILQKVKSIVGELHYKEWVYCVYKLKELQLQQSGHGALARSN